MLREEGGYEYKRAIVNTIIAIVEDNPEAKEAGRVSLSLSHGFFDVVHIRFDSSV